MSPDVDKQETGELVLLTGITGFLAGHIALQLLRGGYRVRGTVRSLARSAGVADRLRGQAGGGGGELVLVEVDLMHDAGWEAAAADCRYVIHTASPFPMRAPKHEDDLVRPAREGTLRVLAAASCAGTRRVVLTSSIAAINYGRGTPPFTEADWTDTDGPITTAYYKSKTLAEQAAWQFAREHTLELAVINPGLVLGPLLDARNGTSVDLVRKLLAGEFPGLPNFGFSLVDVRDVADAHLRAMTVAAAAGERFIAAGRFMTVREIADVLRIGFPQYARKLPTRRLPDWLVRLVARFDADLRSVVGDLGHDGRVAHDKAIRVLGWQPRDEAASIRDTADSLIAFGLA